MEILKKFDNAVEEKLRKLLEKSSLSFNCKSVKKVLYGIIVCLVVLFVGGRINDSRYLRYYHECNICGRPTMCYVFEWGAYGKYYKDYYCSRSCFNESVHADNGTKWSDRELK